MQQNQPANLLKKLLPGLLPILVFVVVDEFWSTEAGLVVALVFGAAQLIYTLIREKRIDRFILADTALLMLMGGISIALDNELFFKLKPALINLIFCAILGLSAFSSKNLLLIYTQRYMGQMTMDEGMQKVFRKMLQLFFWLMLAYTAMIVYSAFYMSREAWAFISGALLYVLFGLFFVWQFITGRLKKRRAAAVEWLPLVDETGKITGRVPRDKAHQGKGMLHPVVHLHVLNSRGELFLQKRPVDKQIQPGKWDTAVGGHVAYGETIEQALAREAAEELNLSGLNPVPLAHYKWETDLESELVYSFRALYNATPVINRQEVADGRFWTQQEIRQNTGKGIFTPNLEAELPLLFKEL